jgi:FemAB-related protein (PEP-CTERM system-associated)
MIGIHITQNVTGEAWNRYLDGHAHSKIYHRHEWQSIYRDVFRQTTCQLTARRGAEIVGALPLVFIRTIRAERMLVSLPYVNYAGICANDETATRALWQAAARVAADNGCRWMELRGGASLPNGEGAIVSGHKVRDFLLLPATASDMWEGFRSKLRSQVKKAWKNGLTEKTGGPELLPAFYRVYRRNMRFLGSPPLPDAFFAAVFEQFPDQATICCVEDGGDPVATGILLKSGPVLEVPWAASRPRSRSSAANMLLYWTMIRHAIETGHSVFDMGRSTPGTGSHRFKRQWGGRSRPVAWTYWQRRPADLPSYTQGGQDLAMARRVWSHLPLWLTETLGGRLIRHIPC